MTKKQKAVLEAIRTFIYHKEYAPTLVELSDALGLRSIATVQKHVLELERRGFITREPHRGRSIRLVKCCPTCERKA